MITINSIYCEYSEYLPKIVSIESTDAPIQKPTEGNITLYSKEKLPTFTINCGITSEDASDKFDQLITLAKERNIVTVIQEDAILQGLLITEIVKSTTYENAISFEITFKQLDIKEFAVSTVPLPESLQQLQEASSEGLQIVEEVDIAPATYPPTVENTLTEEELLAEFEAGVQ